MKDKFAAYHPVVNFIFFIGAILSAMLLIHPVFLGCSMISSIAYYLTVRGRSGWKFAVGMLGMFVLLSLLNPFVNPQGNTVLFHYFRKRPYTLEALYYGIALAAMMVSVLTWFASYNRVMTSDKFLYLFGRFSPSLTLILTMVLRLVPSYKEKAAQLNNARRCIGKGADDLEHAAVLLSTLTSWALEGGVITADSMRSRGYGCGRRTAFSFYHFENRDRMMTGWMILTLGMMCVCCVKGAAWVVYLPDFQIKGFQDPYMFAGVLAYAAFCVIPTVVNLWEELKWRSLKSKI